MIGIRFQDGSYVEYPEANVTEEKDGRLTILFDPHPELLETTEGVEVVAVLDQKDVKEIVDPLAVAV